MTHALIGLAASTKNQYEIDKSLSAVCSLFFLSNILYIFFINSSASSYLKNSSMHSTRYSVSSKSMTKCQFMILELSEELNIFTKDKTHPLWSAYSWAPYFLAIYKDMCREFVNTEWQNAALIILA